MEPTPIARKNHKLIVAVAAFAAFLATFNETYMNVAFAPVMADLGVSVSTVQWLATAYMLGAAVMVPVSAFAYRSIPTKPLFIATTALLVAGSVVGALAATFPILLVGRIIQALGTGLLIPIGMNITLETAPREKLGVYMGIMGSMTTLGPSSSVVIAGVLLNYFNWHALLWVFAALSLACLLFGAVFLRDIAKLTHPRLDALSVALIGIALVGILYGISTVFSGSIIFAIILATVGALFLFLFVKRQKGLKQPLIDLKPLSVKPFSMGVAINMLSLVTMFAMNIIIPIFMQSVLGLPALTASLTLFPAIALSCVLSPLAGRVYDKHGARVLLPLGFACICVFSIALSLFISSGSVMLLAALYLPVIGGSALIIGPVQSFALSQLAPEQNPHGVTVMSTGFQIAGCFGASLFTGVYYGVTTLRMVSVQDMGVAASFGFLAAGALTSVFALIGLALSIRINVYAKKTKPQGDLRFSLADIMKRDVYTLSADDKVADALKLFVEKKISGVPIVDKEMNVKGFISDGDIMRYLADQLPAFKNAWSIIAERENEDFSQMLSEVMSLPVLEIGTRHVVSVDWDAGIGAVCRVLVEHNLRKAPVIKDGRMIGIVNRSNISRFSMDVYLKNSLAAERD